MSKPITIELFIPYHNEIVNVPAVKTDGTVYVRKDVMHAAKISQCDPDCIGPDKCKGCHYYMHMVDGADHKLVDDGKYYKLVYLPDLFGDY